MIKKLITIIALTFSIGAWADVINKTCVSDSGLSIYDISLDTEPNSYGEIRYRFMEQDIFYSAVIRIREDNKLIGIAEFNEGRSGESKGVSWIFTYDTENETLKDNDNIKAKCK